jgi:hypothetical protein
VAAKNSKVKTKNSKSKLQIKARSLLNLPVQSFISTLYNSVFYGLSFRQILLHSIFIFDLIKMRGHN